MELQIQDLVSSIKKDGIDSANQQAAAILADARKQADAIIADAAGVDPHLATGYKMSNYQGAQEIPACRELYSRVAVEIMRAVNFYGFNTPDANLKDLYFTGGHSRSPTVLQTFPRKYPARRHMRFQRDL